MGTKENKNINAQDKVRHEEYLKYMQEVENKKKSIKNFVKGAIATGLVVGTLVTGTACGTKTPVGPDPIDPAQTTTTEPVKPDDPTNPTKPDDPTNPTKPEDPKINESVEAMNKALGIVSERFENKPVDHVSLQLINGRDGKIGVVSFTTYEYSEERGYYLYRNMGEFGTCYITEEQYTDLCNSLEITPRPKGSSIVTKEEFYNKLSNEQLDLVSGIILEKVNKENSCDALDKALEVIKEKYNFETDDVEFYHAQKTEKDAEKWQMFLAHNLSNIGRRELIIYDISQQEFDEFRELLNTENEHFAYDISSFKGFSNSKCIDALIKILKEREPKMVNTAGENTQNPTTEEQESQK